MLIKPNSLTRSLRLSQFNINSRDSIHNIALDFILALPVERAELYNTLLTVSSKFSKTNKFVPGQNDYSAKDWAIRLLAHLRLWASKNIILSFENQTVDQYCLPSSDRWTFREKWSAYWNWALFSSHVRSRMAKGIVGHSIWIDKYHKCKIKCFS